MHSARDAFESTIAAMVDMGRDIPAPSFKPDGVAAPDLLGKFVTRVPKRVSLRSLLAAREPKACP